MWPEMKATSKEEYEAAKAALKQVIATAEPLLDSITSFDEFYAFCKEFVVLNKHDRPIQFWKDEPMATEEEIAELESYGYPADFIDWHRRYGQTHLWLESTMLYHTGLVLKNLKGDWNALLTHNRYLILTVDGGGSAFVFDMNQEPPQIKYADHETTYTRLDSLDELYSEMYGFWWDKGRGAYVNREGLDVDKVKDDEGNYRLDSPYVKQYLAEALESTGQSTFLGYLIESTQKGMANILHRYGIE